MITTLVEIGSGLYNLADPIIHEFEIAQDESLSVAVVLTRGEIVVARGIRSGDLLESYSPFNIQSATRSGDIRTRMLESATGYSDVYEQGRKDVPAYYGRYVAQKGVKAADSRIENILNEAAGRVKRKIEN
jgi:hypothetical protein